MRAGRSGVRENCGWNILYDEESIKQKRKIQAVFGSLAWPCFHLSVLSSFLLSLSSKITLIFTTVLLPANVKCLSFMSLNVKSPLLFSQYCTFCEI